MAMPVCADPSDHRYRRAVVTIELLGLNARNDLLDERASRIVALAIALRALDGGSPDERRYARTALVVEQHRRRAHASCARSFCRLWEADRPKAEALAEYALRLLESRASAQ